jgi:hypothetical protein
MPPSEAEDLKLENGVIETFAHAGLECPANLVPVDVRQTGMRGA